MKIKLNENLHKPDSFFCKPNTLILTVVKMHLFSSFIFLVSLVFWNSILILVTQVVTVRNKEKSNKKEIITLLYHFIYLHLVCDPCVG